MSEFKFYRKTQLQEMRCYVLDEDMTSISVGNTLRDETSINELREQR
jgi:hypothetical protein